MYAKNIRCDSAHNGQRCAKSLGHSGWHQSGIVEWLEQTTKASMPVCPVAITLDDGRRIRCQEPAKHPGAHRGQHLIWTDAQPALEDL